MMLDAGKMFGINNIKHPEPSIYFESVEECHLIHCNLSFQGIA